MCKKIILIVIIISIPVLSIAAPIDLNIPADDFGDFVVWIYNAIIFISALAAFGVIVWGGLEYLTSAGNPSRMQSGMNRIQDAIIGILIVLISYLILQTINPELLELPDLAPPQIQ